MHQPLPTKVCELEKNLLGSQNKEGLPFFEHNELDGDIVDDDDYDMSFVKSHLFLAKKIVMDF